MSKITDRSDAPSMEYSAKIENKSCRESHVLLTNRQEFSAYFTVFFSMWAMNNYKYCTLAVCRSGSTKRTNLNYGCFLVKSDDSKKWEVLCKRSGKKFKRLIDPRICLLHPTSQKPTSQLAFLVGKYFFRLPSDFL